MKYWQQFQQFEYSNEVLLIVGALLLFFGVLQILRNGIKMLFWVIISTIGIVSVTYGMQNSPYNLPSMETVRSSNLSEIFSSKSTDVLMLLCEKLSTRTP